MSTPTPLPHHAHDRITAHPAMNLPPTPNPEPADDAHKAALSSAKAETTGHLDWLKAHHRVLEKSLGGRKGGVVERSDVPVVVSGEELSLAELVAVAR